MQHNARELGHLLAVVDGDQRVTYGEFYELAMAAGAAFLRAGLQRGDRVAIWMQNSLEWLVLASGVQCAGGTVVPLNTRLKGRESQYILNKSGARFLVMVDEFLGNRYPDLLDGLDLPNLKARFVLSTGTASSLAAFSDPADPPARLAIEKAAAAVSAEDTAMIIFTSGTTGHPKGVRIGHGQCIAVYRLWAESVGVRSGDRYLVVSPFFHTLGYGAGVIASWIMGATVYPLAVFDVTVIADIVRRERITVLPGTPAVFQSFLDSGQQKQGAFASVRLSVTGGSPVAPALVERMRDELGIRSVMTGYGLTETCGTVSMTAAGDSPARVADTCGRPLTGIEVKCVDSHGNEVPVNASGEILIRGFNVMQGYFDDEDATAQTLDAEGWLRTGDIGSLDSLGYLRITDRIKDMFIVGGFNCYPAEIENVMMGYEGISQVAVVGVPDGRLGEVGKAYVVPVPGGTIDQARLVAWCRENIAHYKVPKYVEIVPELPRTAMGKVQKFELRAKSK